MYFFKENLYKKTWLSEIFHEVQYPVRASQGLGKRSRSSNV